MAEDLHIESRLNKAADHINILQKDEKIIKETLVNEDIALKTVEHQLE